MMMCFCTAYLPQEMCLYCLLIVAGVFARPIYLSSMSVWPTYLSSMSVWPATNSLGSGLVNTITELR